MSTVGVGRVGGVWLGMDAGVGAGGGLGTALDLIVALALAFRPVIHL